MENLEKEKEQLSHAVEINSLTARLMQSVVDHNRRLWIALVISWVIIAGLIGCLVYQSANMQNAVAAAIAESQETFNQALSNAFDTIAEMEVVSDITTTTTQTVEGDSAVINNVEGEQYNDSSQKNGGGD